MISLEKMTIDSFKPFMEKSQNNYSKDIALSLDILLEEAEKFSADQMLELLPGGFLSKGHFFYDIVDDNLTVGCLWIYIQEKCGTKMIFIYDIFVEESFRRKGIGSEALRVLEILATKMDIHRVGLHVFAHKKLAYKLYRKMGFKERNIGMRKDF